MVSDICGPFSEFQFCWGSVLIETIRISLFIYNNLLWRGFFLKYLHILIFKPSLKRVFPKKKTNKSETKTPICMLCFLLYLILDGQIKRIVATVPCSDQTGKKHPLAAGVSNFTCVRWVCGASFPLPLTPEKT